MEIHRIGNPKSINKIIAISHEAGIENLKALSDEITKAVGTDYYLVGICVDDWNHDLSPWEAPAVFGNENFGSGAEKTLEYIVKEIVPKLFLEKEKLDSNKLILAGYSLAGLFALWASTKTGIFNGIVAASPSAWFPGYTNYIKENKPKADRIYLSLGDKEAKTKNPVMRTVGDCIGEIHKTIEDCNIETILCWNAGNHFKDVNERVAKGIGWVLKGE